MKILIAVLCCMAFVTVNAQKRINLNDTSSPAKLSVKMQDIPEKYLKEAKAGRIFTINKALQSAQSVNVGDIVDLQLFEDKNYTATVRNIVTDVNGTLALTLKLPDYPMGFAIITTSTEGKSLLTVSIPELGQSFGSRCSVDSKANYLLEIDESKIERPHLENDAIKIPEGIEIIGNENDKKAKNIGEPLKSAQAYSVPTYNTNTDDPATIRLLIVYTPAAAASSYAYNRGGINNVISLMIALGNTCLSNSQTGITLTLAHSAQVDYTENNNMDASLYRLQNPYDGYMDNVHTLRKQHKAALVQLLTTDNDGGGLGYLLANTGGNYNYGFSVCWVNQVADAYPASVHELGHNMGLGHGAQHIKNKATGIFSYSYGWRWTGTYNSPYGTNQYGSVMTYWTGENYSDGIACYNVPYFSNPNVSYLGGATGDATQADAARSLREMKHVIAYYSEKYALSPDAPTNIIVSNPTEHGATFTWDACANATEYKVCVPTGGGAYSSYTTTNTTYTVNDNVWFPSSCTDYEFFIMAVNEYGGDASSATLTFKTKCATDPTVTTEVANSVTYNTATLNKTVTTNGAAITEQGFKYKKSSESSWQTSTTDNLTGLTANTQYKFYAYATTELGTFNGAILTFTTTESPTFDAKPAVGKWKLVSAPFISFSYSDFSFSNSPRVVLRNLTSTATQVSWVTATNSATYAAGDGFAYQVSPKDV
ncbi:MAG: M12 family metallo-peptidase, partial [Prevotellaceae bacterium]|nr:M12 family metallo-peptidase [Prevotellaceae bacterium]